MRCLPEPDDAPEAVRQKPITQTIHCSLCQLPGPVHYRVRSDVIRDWRLICPQCWLQVERQPGYQYGGTRKASRRQRKR